MAIFDDDALILMNKQIETELKSLLIKEDYDEIDELLEDIISKLHKAIPDNKRISYGITYVVKTFSKYLFEWLKISELEVFETAIVLYENMKTFHTKCVGLGVISHYGVSHIDDVLPYFKHAASHEMWEIREFSHMYIRKITKKHPIQIQEFLISLTKSDDPNHRRYASESLRPVVENRWILKEPEFSLKVLRNLFKESDPYPRVSVGNNLSDMSRSLPELIFEVVEELIKSGNENSYWIANRACRNLIIKEPIRVMDILGVDTYDYKNRKYKRSDYES